MTEQLERDVRDFIVDNFLFGQDDGLTREQSLVESGIIDSMGVAELVAFIETRYAITVADDELVPDNLDSIERVVDFVERKREPAAV